MFCSHAHRLHNVENTHCSSRFVSRSGFSSNRSVLHIEAYLLYDGSAMQCLDGRERKPLGRKHSAKQEETHQRGARGIREREAKQTLGGTVPQFTRNAPCGGQAPKPRAAAPRNLKGLVLKNTFRHDGFWGSVLVFRCNKCSLVSNVTLCQLPKSRVATHSTWASF